MVNLEPARGRHVGTGQLAGSAYSRQLAAAGPPAAAALAPWWTLALVFGRVFQSDEAHH